MKDVREEEEESTAGVTPLTSTPVTVSSTEDKELESRKLVAIPEAEEALEVGTERGKTMLCMVCAVCHECMMSCLTNFPGEPDAKLQVILEEVSGVTTPNPSEDQGEEPKKELPPVEVVSEEPATENVHTEDSVKMDLAETSQVELTGEPGDQVSSYCKVQTETLSSSFQFQSPEEQPSSSTCSVKSEDGVTLKVPLVDDRRLSEGNITDPGSSKRQKPLTSRSQPVSPHTERSNRTKRDPSPTPSSSSETSSLVEQVSASRPPPLPCTVGEKVNSASHME